MDFYIRLNLTPNLARQIWMKFIETFFFHKHAIPRGDNLLTI